MANELETRAGVAKLLNDYLEHTGISIRELARRAEVDEKTARNWLDALSEPKLTTVVKLFNVANLPMLPFLIRREAAQGDKRQQLEYYVSNMATDADIDNLYYVLAGKHGSSASSVLIECACNMACTMHHRYQVARSVLDNYLYDEHAGENLYSIPQEELERFRSAIELGRQASLSGEGSYSQNF